MTKKKKKKALRKATIHSVFAKDMARITRRSAILTRQARKRSLPARPLTKRDWVANERRAAEANEAARKARKRKR